MWIQLEDGTWIRDPATSWLGNNKLLAYLQEKLPAELNTWRENARREVEADPERSVQQLRLALEGVTGPLGIPLEEGLNLVPEEFAGLNSHEFFQVTSLVSKGLAARRAWEDADEGTLRTALEDAPETLPAEALLKVALGVEQVPEDPSLKHELHTLRAQFIKDRVRLRGEMTLFESALTHLARGSGLMRQDVLPAADEIAFFSPDYRQLRTQDETLSQAYLQAVRSALAARGLLPEGR